VSKDLERKKGATKRTYEAASRRAVETLRKEAVGKEEGHTGRSSREEVADPFTELDRRRKNSQIEREISLGKLSNLNSLTLCMMEMIC
jgi:hypothetical protein